ncbi:hypothetical protein DKX38_011777 [Salix brachista]|uniref:Uncharacterized protein n=1 Tax=Salix brachista TaxID=2182728 RepID=A0A5N5M259_9ROSI|nr:hypothetical protein DKX38_011777 [Salix brachista]
MQPTGNSRQNGFQAAQDRVLEELKTGVLLLVAKLLHRNLVRTAVGFLLLVYVNLPNGSLDNFLFAPPRPCFYVSKANPGSVSGTEDSDSTQLSLSSQPSINGLPLLSLSSADDLSLLECLIQRGIFRQQKFPAPDFDARTCKNMNKRMT